MYEIQVILPKRLSTKSFQPRKKYDVEAALVAHHHHRAPRTGPASWKKSNGLSEGSLAEIEEREDSDGLSTDSQRVSIQADEVDYGGHSIHTYLYFVPYVTFAAQRKCSSWLMYTLISMQCRMYTRIERRTRALQCISTI